MTKDEAINQLVGWLYTQVGYKADNKWNKYAEELDQTNWYNGKKNGYDWCCVFADYAFYHVFGYDNAKKMEYQPDKSLGAACYYAANYFKQNDAYFSTPQVGDRIFYGADADDHTGIVVAVNDTTIETIEGNVSDSVVHNIVKKSDRWIDGYGRPDWSVVADEPGPEPPQPDPPAPEPQYTTTITIRNLGIEDEGNDVVALQGILMANGYDLEYCGGADGIFGEGTEAAVQEYQLEHGLEDDGVVGPKTWDAMLGRFALD